jgi:hypothetical protein
MRTLALAALLLAAPTLAQSTALTYQGRLDDAGQPANGLYDLRFRLFDNADAGTPIGPALCADNVQVNNGLFTVLIDFGPQFATTTPRFLQVDARADTGLSCADASAFTPLLPRQPVTPTPLAQHAATANALAAPDGAPNPAVSVDNSGNVGVGTAAPAAKLHVSGGDILAGRPGAEWLFHTRSHVLGEFLQITDNDNGVPQFQRGLVINQNGGVGIGTVAPSSPLHVVGDIRCGAAGNSFAVTAFSADRLMRGQVNANGTVDAARSSAGFTVSRSSTGVYVINFTSTFSSPPVIVTTPMGACCKTHVTQTQTTFATVFVQNVGTGVQTDSPFQFIVMGR